MTKKVMIALGCIALLTSLSGIAAADIITFDFGFSSNQVDISTAALKVTQAISISVSDASTGVLIDPFPGKVSVTTGAASSYSNTGGIINAVYMPGGYVEVLSAWCTGGAMPGTCLLGSNNGNGTYATTSGKSASFQGLFTVTYVSPYIFNLFGLQNVTFDPNSGSDSVTTGNNHAVSTTDAKATLGGGTVTFTTVPEPGTLAMLGGGILGLAGWIRRKLQ